MAGKVSSPDPSTEDRAVAPGPPRPGEIDGPPEYEAPISVRPWLAFAAIVAVVVLVGGAFELGLGPFARPAPAPATPLSNSPTFDAAWAAARAAASEYSSDQWTLAAAGGLAPTSSWTESLREAATLGNSWSDCSISAVGSSGSIEVPAATSAPFDGTATVWSFVFGAGFGAGLVVIVRGQLAVPYATLSGGGCIAFLSRSVPLANGTLDSPRAVELALAVGGSEFVRLHTNVSLSLTLTAGTEAGAVTTSSLWDIAFYACPLGPSSGGGSMAPEFNVTLEAQGGSVVSTSNSSGPCPGSSSNSALGMARGFPDPHSGHEQVPGQRREPASFLSPVLPIASPVLAKLD
jgi:hypothetical protein